MTQDRPPAGLAGTVDHVDAGDGWLVVRLMTRQALVREGVTMNHCLADGTYACFAGEEEMTGHSIWSLRDPDAMSVVTLDVRRVTDSVPTSSWPWVRSIDPSAVPPPGA